MQPQGNGSERLLEALRGLKLHFSVGGCGVRDGRLGAATSGTGKSVFGAQLRLAELLLKISMLI